MAVVLAFVLVTVGFVASQAGFDWGRPENPGISAPNSSPTGNVGAPRGFGLTNPGALQVHAPIHIDGNAGFTLANGVRSGTGTKTDPYIISDWSIDLTNFPNTVAGLWIQHATKYTIVRNIEVKNLNGIGNYFGILLGTNTYPPVTTDWAENITVTHVLVHHMSIGYGIQASYYTKNNNMSFNAVYMNITQRDWQYGITCQGGTQNCVIWGNYVDARNAQPGPTYTMNTVGIQAGDGCMVSFSIQILPCATVTVAYNTVTNATAEGFVSDGTTYSSFFNNLAYQNYPGRKLVSGYTSRGIMVESRSNYSKVHDNEFYQFSHGIEIGAWGGWYWNNTVHDNDVGIYVDVNNSFLNVRFTVFNTIWNTAYYGNANGNFYIPPGQYTVLLDAQSGVTPTSFPVQYVNQGKQTISRVRLLWEGTDVTTWYDLSASGFMKAVTIYDHQKSTYSQFLDVTWKGSNLALSVGRFTPNDLLFSLQSGIAATFSGAGFNPTSNYRVFKGGNQMATILTNSAGALSFAMPIPASASYEVRLVQSFQPPAVTLTAPVNNSYLTTSSVQATWTASGTGSGPLDVELTLDGGSPINVTGLTGYTLPTLSEGRHVVQVVATEPPGPSATAWIAFTVDTQRPFVSITNPVDNATVNTTSILLTWTATDATSGMNHIEILLDGGGGVPSSGNNYSLVGLTEGPHTVSLIATDNAGLRTTAAVRFTVNTSSSTPGKPDSGPAIAAVTYSPDSSAVDIAFTQPMNQTSVATSVAISPNVPYDLHWVSTSHVRVVIRNSLVNGAVYQVTLGNTAKDSTGTPLGHPFLFQFLANSPDPIATPAYTNWIAIILLIVILLLTVNWMTAGVLVFHYRADAKKVRSALGRISRRYQGSLVIVYKRLARSPPHSKKANSRASAKAPVKAPERDPSAPVIRYGKPRKSARRR